ncbi:MAG TPA: chromate transporter, partial [Rheinheimera sp.]|uniref:chromate transporter n=1 Tax=Rheinheimera sp. TaxID=1869214 RepID=UPI002F95221D
AQLFGAEQLPLAGAVAAAVVTFFTFLPSFLFILLGAPLVEASRQQATLAAPLSAITAAVVGVIVNLALFFGYFVLFPHGTDTGVDWCALLLGLAAALALFRYQQGIVRVLAACAAGGILLQQCC